MGMQQFRALEGLNAEKPVIEPLESHAQQVDLALLEEADLGGRLANAEVQNTEGALLSLESIKRYLAQEVGTGADLGEQGAKFANIAIEAICDEAGISAGALAFSIEAYRQDPAVSLEGALDVLGEKIKAAWNYIKEQLARFFRYLAEKMDFFRRNTSNLTKRIHELEAKLAKAKQRGCEVGGALRPSKDFSCLLYLQSGFPASGHGIAGAVDDLLQAHARLFTETIAKQLAWLKANHEAASTSVEVINDLSVKRDDFLMLEAEPMNRSIAKRMPLPGNMFYRSRELPGGQAIYTQIQPQDARGILAIDMLANIRVHIAPFDPVSYDAKALKVAEQAQAEMNRWWLSLPPEVRARTPMPHVSSEAAKVSGTGSKVQLQPDMVFNTLSLAEIEERLGELKATQNHLEHWYRVVFGQIWKDKDFDFLAGAVLAKSNDQTPTTGVYLSPAPKYLASLVLAMLNVMQNATESTHAYAFTTCFAMLNYVQASLEQHLAAS